MCVCVFVCVCSIIVLTRRNQSTWKVRRWSRRRARRNKIFIIRTTGDTIHAFISYHPHAC